MDPEIVIIEDSSDSSVLQNEIEFFVQRVATETNKPGHLNSHCNLPIKTEIKSENPFSDFYLHNETEFFTKHLVKQIKCEKNSKNSEIETKTDNEEQTVVSDFDSQNKREYLPDISVISVKKFNSNNVIHDTVPIAQEPGWLVTGTSSVCDDIEDRVLPSVILTRLSTEAVPGDGNKSPLPSTEVLINHKNFYAEKDLHESEDSDVTEIEVLEEDIHSEQPGKSSGKGDIVNWGLYSKQKNLIHESDMLQNCNFCNMSITLMSHRKCHELTYKCEICKESFTAFSDLEKHKLGHKGKKRHECKQCHKSYSKVTDLKRHNWIHEGVKPYKCYICDKSFVRSSYLGVHLLNHGEILPNNYHKCKTCGKAFRSVFHLKTHTLIHDGTKPYKCKTCDKSFNQLCNLKVHNFTHERNGNFKCEICHKTFSHLSYLKRHNLAH